MSDDTHLGIVPLSLADANAYVRQHHRHARPVVGHKFSIGVMQADVLVGVAIVGRPIARHNDTGWTLEILRVATNGTRNACSVLEGACCRAVFAQGYRRVITYTRKSEGGASLRAAGFRIVGEVSPREWHCTSRPRVVVGDLEAKWLWERTA